MLLQAGLLARAGRRVCLLERETRLGGSWQTGTLENGEEVEIACHVIEVFPGVYDLLAEGRRRALCPLGGATDPAPPHGAQGRLFSAVR